MYFLTSCSWITVAFFAAMPLASFRHITFTDAFFEAMSGITTTGASVLSDLDHTAPVILMWRSLLQWIGGIGFVAMAIAILPMLRIGGMRLFQTESSDRSEKVLPRSHIIAKYILVIYLCFTLLGTLGYYLAGMPIFEAINHAMTSVATGGYSTSDSSLSKFPIATHWVAMVLMILGSLPFTIYVTMARGNLLALFRDEQVRGFFKLLFVVSLLFTIWYWKTMDEPILDSIRIATFSIISIISTTAFTLDDYSTWGGFAIMLFFYLTFVGGCSGSTTGGLKIFRFQVAIKLLVASLKHLIHPRAVIPQKYNGHNLDEEIVRSILTFTFFFFFIIAFMALFFAFIGYDMITAISGSITIVCNVGQGSGGILPPSGNFSPLSDIAKWVLALGMLLGRLEIITIVVLLTPGFWRY